VIYLLFGIFTLDSRMNPSQNGVGEGWDVEIMDTKAPIQGSNYK